MKKIRVFTLITAAVTAAALAFAFNGVTTAQAADAAGRVISVSGSGSVNVNPDVAYVSMGVRTHDASPTVAMEANNAAMDTVIAALTGMGIAERDIRTTGFYMNQSYDYSTGEEIPTGFDVSNNLTVVVRAIDTAGDVIGTAADAGANVFSGVEFGLLDSASAYNDALLLALENAGGKAGVIAGSLNVTIGAPSSVTESGGYARPVYAGAANMAPMEMDAAVPVQAGKLTVTAEVQVTYSY